MPAGIEPAPWE